MKMNTSAAVKKTQLRLFYRRNIFRNIFFVCWGDSNTADDKKIINKLNKKAGSIVGSPQFVTGFYSYGDSAVLLL